MNSVEQLLQRVRDLGVHLEPRPDGGLSVHPFSKLPPELAAELRRHKAEVLSTLNPRRGWRSLPPVDLPLVMVKPSPTPIQREMVISYLVRQCWEDPLLEWLSHRNTVYFETIAKTWDCGLGAYAVARDAACWQLERTEVEVWSLLEGIDSAIEDLMSKPVK